MSNLDFKEMDSKEIGIRCKKIRTGKGMTMQELAAQIPTSVQNVNNWEKRGVSDINTIRAISRALGYDLLQDEIDAEINVNMIGRELLANMIKNKGMLDILFPGWALYGLSEKKINNEIYKLIRMGLCVREKYTDFDDEEKENVFITANGIITLKQLGFKDDTINFEDGIVMNAGIGKEDSFLSYEHRCDGYDTYQEYIDAHPFIHAMVNLERAGGFRSNIVHFLMNNFRDDYGYLVDELMPYSYGYQYDSELFAGYNCFTDIMYSMMSCFSREDADIMMDYYYGEEESTGGLIELTDDNMFKYEFYSFLKRKLDGLEFEPCEGVQLIPDLEKLHEKIVIKSDVQEVDEEIQRKIERILSIGPAVPIESLKSSNADKDLLDCFTTEQIKEFIKKNIRPAKTKEEKALEKQLHKLYKMEESLMWQYFTFPQSWEDNGIADMLRDIYGWKDLED